MKNLINFILAIIIWLGLFEVSLIQPLAVLPITTVLEHLTAVDYLLLAFCFIVVSVATSLFDYYTQPKASQAVKGFGVKHRVIKRGDRI